VRKALAVYDCKVLPGGFFYGGSIASDTEEIVKWVNDRITVKK